MSQLTRDERSDNEEEEEESSLAEDESEEEHKLGNGLAVGEEDKNSSFAAYLHQRTSANQRVCADSCSV